MAPEPGFFVLVEGVVGSHGVGDEVDAEFQSRVLG